MKNAIKLWVGMGLAVSSYFLVGCVPKTQFEDQQSRLNDAHAKIKNLEESAAECDKDAFIQFREQTQSLELMTQELVDRNAELSKEVARLKVVESDFKGESLACERKLGEQKADYEGKIARVRATYEDLVKELKADIAKLKAEKEKSEAKARSAAPAKAPKMASTKSSKAAPSQDKAVAEAPAKESGAKKEVSGDTSNPAAKPHK